MDISDLLQHLDIPIKNAIKWPGAKLSNFLYRLGDGYEEERGFPRKAPAAVALCVGGVLWAILILGVMYAID